MLIYSKIRSIYSVTQNVQNPLATNIYICIYSRVTRNRDISKARPIRSEYEVDELMPQAAASNHGGRQTFNSTDDTDGEDETGTGNQTFH